MLGGSSDNKGGNAGGFGGKLQPPRRRQRDAVKFTDDARKTAREQKAETLQDRIEVNKLDITLPGSELHAATKKQESRGWKARQEKLSAGRGQKQGRARGYRQTRDDP
jgi:hypothetical protein